MIRYFISQERIQTTEGRLPTEMFISTDDVVSGWQGYIDPPQLKTIPSPMAKFIYGLQRGEVHGLTMVQGSSYEENLRMWNMAIATANTPPAKIAKPGEVWERTDGISCSPTGMYYVSPHSEAMPLVMRHVATGYHEQGGTRLDGGKGGIRLDHPDDWTCHGLLTDLIAKGKA